MNLLKSMAICIASALVLVGCGSPIETAKKIGQVIIDPNIQVGEKEAQPSTIRFSLLADADINPNFSGNATPLQVTVVYLREDSKLLNLALDELTDVDIETVLGKNYLDHQDYTLIPGQFKTLEEVKLYKENQYIAVIAYYAADADSEWKRIIQAKGKGEEYKLLIHAQKNSIDIRQDGDNLLDSKEFKVKEPEELYPSEDEVSGVSEVNVSEEITRDFEPSEALIEATEFEVPKIEETLPINELKPLSFNFTEALSNSEAIAINGVETMEVSKVTSAFLASSRAVITPIKWKFNGTNELIDANENIKSTLLSAIGQKAPVTRIRLESTQPILSKDFINVRATNKVVIIESLN